MIHKTGIRIEQTISVKHKLKQRQEKKRNKKQKQCQSQKIQHPVKYKTSPHTTNNVIKT